MACASCSACCLLRPGTDADAGRAGTHGHSNTNCLANLHPNADADVDPDTASKRHTDCHLNADIDAHADIYSYAHRDGCPFANPDPGGRQLSLVERFGLS